MPTWTNGAFDNTLPANSRDPRLGAGDIRQWKKQVAEFLGTMLYGLSSSELDSALMGFKHIRLTVQSAPGATANMVKIYSKDVNGKAEFFAQDEDGDEIQLTSGGVINLSIAEGTTDDTEADKLHDTDGGFDATMVGAVVWNTTDDTYTVVSGYVDSGELDLADDIMTSGETYKIYHSPYFVALAGAQTIKGIKTFSSIPVGPDEDPTADNQLARKKYIDDALTDSRARAVKSGGNQSVNAGEAKVLFQTETYDTNTELDSSRFTAKTAGYVDVKTMIKVYEDGSSTGYPVAIRIKKNGTLYSEKTSYILQALNASYIGISHEDQIPVDVDDYIEIFWYAAATSAISNDSFVTFKNSES